MSDHTKCKVTADVRIGPGEPLCIIAGPCVLESVDLCEEVGQVVADTCRRLGFSCIFKTSYDKANRSSVNSPRGPGLENGLARLREIRSRLGLPITTDIHEPSHAAPAGAVVDLIQIPAFLCRQTDLLVAAARTGRAIKVKTGPYRAPGT